MRLRSMKNIIRQYWDMILMPYTVIDLVNISEKYQQEILVFTDRKGRLVGDGDVDLTGEDGDGDEMRPSRLSIVSRGGTSQSG